MTADARSFDNYLDNAKQLELLTQYSDLIRMYHRSLDLMSDRAVATLDEKLREGLCYAQMLRRYPELLQVDDTLNDNALNKDNTQRVVLDLGSGVGLPGIPLAISCPGLEVILVERRRKRATFLQIVLSKLGLENAMLVAEDVRNFQGEQVHCVTAQAVGQFLDSYRLTQHLHAERVSLISRKGNSYQAEVTTLQETLGMATGIIEPPVVRELALNEHATLVALNLTGGIPCPS
ncbi:MAG: RsmG family class I SAM-dependent methyltransferase [Deinococcota bacterium]